ncbi:MAG: hypothetical protein ABSF28_15055 [Terracidiphilus sp.]|jgi:hypothetical protein
MLNEELEARINKAFPVFSYGDAHMNRVLGLDSVWIDRNEIKRMEETIDLLSRNLLQFLNIEFPRKGMSKGIDWCRTICDLKMKSVREGLERVKKIWKP